MFALFLFYCFRANKKYWRLKNTILPQNEFGARAPCEVASNIDWMWMRRNRHFCNEQQQQQQNATLNFQSKCSIAQTFRFVFVAIETTHSCTMHPFKLDRNRQPVWRQCLRVSIYSSVNIRLFCWFFCCCRFFLFGSLTVLFEWVKISFLVELWWDLIWFPLCKQIPIFTVTMCTALQDSHKIGFRKIVPKKKKKKNTEESLRNRIVMWHSVCRARALNSIQCKQTDYCSINSVVIL